MTRQPIIHKYHFNDSREQILAKLETIFQKEHILSTLHPAGYKYVCALVDINSTNINTSIILVNDNVIVHTAFPKDNERYPRLWMVNSFIGQITYIEIENPDLRNINKIDFSNPTGNAYEMGLMPHDANLLIDILDKVVIAISSDTATNNYLIDPGIKKLITG